MDQDAMLLDAPLPADVAILQRMIRELLATLKDTQYELDGVRHQLDRLLKRLYGPKAERFNPNQPSLFDGLLPPPGSGAALPALATESAAEAARSRKNGHGRKRLPEHLERRRIEHDLTEAEKRCPCCHEPRVKIGEETSEQLEYKPASMFVIQHVRPTYACVNCLKQAATPVAMPEPATTPEPVAMPEPEPMATAKLEPATTPKPLESWLPPAAGDEFDALLSKLIVTASMPRQPIDKGLPGPGLLAHVIVSKYVDHLPLHRQERIFTRQGVELSRSTMCDWMAACARLLTPLYQLLIEQVLRSRTIHTDDTTVPVQEAGQNRTKSGRLWVYIGDRDHPATVYEYTATHARDGPATFLKGFEGFLQADAANLYDGIYTTGKIVEVGCMAHCRRHFHEARTSDTAVAHETLARIRALYAVEDEAAELIAAGKLTGEAADAVRLRLRQEKTKPLLTSLSDWLKEQALKALPKSPIGLAIAYALRHWQALTRFADQGFLNIDNNAAERALRGIALGRKNWLFAGSDEGAKTAAVLYSIVATCKQLGVDPFAYLCDVLARLPNHPTASLAELLPAPWAIAAREEAAKPT
jgi:transposase